TNVGHYSANGAYFNASGVDASPLHAAATGPAGGNGVYQYGEAAFPAQTFNGTNYWVDVVFDSTPDRAAPQTQTVSDGAFVTAHSVRLTGLITNTSYFFRVRSADRSGNVAQKPSGGPTPPPLPGQTPPPPQAFTMPSPTLHDTRSADFAAGSLGGAYLAEDGDGEVTLPPDSGAEFSGSTLPPDWSTNIWSAG